MSAAKKTPGQRAAAKAWRTIRRGPSKAQGTALGWLDIADNWLRIDESRFVEEKRPYWRHAEVQGHVAAGRGRVSLVTLRVLEKRKWIERKTKPVVCGGSKGIDGMPVTVATWTRWAITPKGRKAYRVVRGKWGI